MKVNREIVRMQLLNWCAAPGEGKSYFRPLMCRGNVENVDIFLVHSHPVTPVPPPAPELYRQFLEKYPLADFVNRLLDYGAFDEMHSNVRQALGKDLTTLPQQRTTAFVEANPRADVAVAEAFVNAYPAKDAAALKKEDRKIIQRGNDLFYEMLQLFKPAWIILLGKPAFDDGARYLNQRFGVQDFHKKWQEVEVKEPQLIKLATFKLHGVKCRVAGCRHFDKRGLHGVTDSDYSEERFKKFCKSAWETIYSE